jgi:hypothetical protein
MRVNRRDFLIQSSVAAGSLLTGCNMDRAIRSTAPAKGVSIICLKDDVVSAPPSRWAVERLRQTLSNRGILTRLGSEFSEAVPGDIKLVVTGPVYTDLSDRPHCGPQELRIGGGTIDDGAILYASGGDPRGVVYALTELSDAAAYGQDPLSALRPQRDVHERPANAVRSCMRMFCSDVEDKPWFNDRAFWEAYLTMLVTNRFNRFHLAFGLGYDFVYHSVRDSYTHFMYPFFLRVPGYDVRASNLDAAERDRNLEMLRFISDQAALRGLQFQLGVWNLSYNWPMGEGVNHMIEGLTPDTHAAYCRDALAILLRECPGITGLTFRIHGEGGIAEGSYDFWKTIFDAPVKCGRRIEIDMHSKGIDQGMIDTAVATGLPVTVSPKYWAEHLGLPYHQAAIRPTEMPTGRRATGVMALSTGERNFTRYGYADLLREDRKFGVIHRIWPGTQRLLLWGDPEFAAGYGRAMSFCGSIGCELMEPLSFKGRKGSGNPGGRDAYLDQPLNPRYDFEKYLYTYRLWGRMLYNPDTDPEVWQRQLRHEYGDSAAKIEIALSSASRILPLFTTAHTPSAANNNYWPEMYVNMSIVEPTTGSHYRDTPQPRYFGTVSPLDSQLFSRVDDFAADLARGFVVGKYSPAEVAAWLDDLSAQTEKSLAEARNQSASRTDAAFRRFEIDVTVQIELGRFFAHKLRAAILWALVRHIDDGDLLPQAIREYEAARQSYANVVEATRPVYVSDVSFGIDWFQRGHWSDRLEAIDQDIAKMKKAMNTKGVAAKGRGIDYTKFIMSAADRRQRLPASIEHTPPRSFQPGQELSLYAIVHSQEVRRAQLYFRHTNQAEPWRVEEMRGEAGVYRAAIPGDYTQSPYPLQYYFELAAESPPVARIYPGFVSSLSNQPYYVVRPS